MIYAFVLLFLYGPTASALLNWNKCQYATVWSPNILASGSNDSLHRVYQLSRNIECHNSTCWQEETLQYEKEDLVIGLHQKGYNETPPVETKAIMKADVEKSFQHSKRLLVQAHFPKESLVTSSIKLLHPEWNESVTIRHEPSHQIAEEFFIVYNKEYKFVRHKSCTRNTSHPYHSFEFIWNEKWMRTFIDGSLLGEHVRSAATDDQLNVTKHEMILEVTVKSLDASRPVPITASSIKLHQVQLDVSAKENQKCFPSLNVHPACSNKVDIHNRVGSVQGSLSWNEVQTFINDTVATYPTLAASQYIGRSVEGRLLHALCIGACHYRVPAKTLYTGMHHAREPISMMNLVYTIDYVLHAVQNHEFWAMHLLSSRQLWFVLIVNPDGYVDNIQQKIWQEGGSIGRRKNMQLGCRLHSDTGVDLNRNYDMCFNQDEVGSSVKVCGEDYRGPKAFSEPESQAIRYLVEESGHDFHVALNYHSFGRYINLPFACEPMGKPNDSSLFVFQKVASEMARYNQYTYGEAWEESQLYTVNGETSDWMWAKHGIYAMSPETGPGFEAPADKGFWPDSADVPALSKELIYSNVHAARVSGPLYNVSIPSFSWDEDAIKIQVKVENVGVRDLGLRNVVELFVVEMLEGQAVHHKTLDIKELGSLHRSTSSKWKLGFTTKQERSGQLYVIVRDPMGCHITRVSMSSLQGGAYEVWEPLLLPLCGICNSLGGKDRVSLHGNESLCVEKADVIALEASLSAKTSSVLMQDSNESSASVNQTHDRHSNVTLEGVYGDVEPKQGLVFNRVTYVVVLIASTCALLLFVWIRMRRQQDTAYKRPTYAPVERDEENVLHYDE